MNGKTKKTNIVWLASLLILVAALPINSVAAKTPVTYDFDKSLSDWGSGTDNSTQYSLTLQHEDASPFGGLPNGYANLKFIPSSTKTGAWMIVKIPTGDLGIVNVLLTFAARNTGNCKACLLMAYAGSETPATRSQFSDLTLLKDPPLDNSWQTFTYSTQAKTDKNGTVYVAIGWGGSTDMLAETGSVGFDNVSVVPYPAP